MPEYLIGFHQPTIDSAVSFWPDTTDMNAGIFKYLYSVLYLAHIQHDEFLQNQGRLLRHQLIFLYIILDCIR